MQHIRGFIFDLDGTLVSSSLNFLAIKAEIGCPADVDALVYISQLPSQAEKDHAMNIIHHHELLDAEACNWLPGAQQFVAACADAQLPMAIVTRNSHRSSMLKINRNSIPIDLVITRENAKPKPDPSALLSIANTFNLPPDELLMVGDYKYDLQAGRNAGMSSCLVNYDQLPEYAHLADYCFPSFQGLYNATFKSQN